MNEQETTRQSDGDTGEPEGTGKLSPSLVRQLKSKAQLLKPTLWIGKQGVTDAFIASLDQALNVHQLVKVKFASFKDQKKELSPLLAEKTSSHVILRVGNTVVLYRPKTDF
jgi:RNA-binding protein